jgi:hypothetical protein
MAYGLLVVTVLFACVLGHGLALNGFTVWTVLLFTVSFVVCFQSAFVLTAVARVLLEKGT